MSRSVLKKMSTCTSMSITTMITKSMNIHMSILMNTITITSILMKNTPTTITMTTTVSTTTITTLT